MSHDIGIGRASTGPVSERRLVITAVLAGSWRIAEVARTYGVSQGWISRLMARYAVEGAAAFEPRSRRPQTSPRATRPPHGRAAMPMSCDITQRRAWDSNPRWVLPHSGFQDRRHRPLGEPSWRGRGLCLRSARPHPGARPLHSRRGSGDQEESDHLDGRVRTRWVGEGTGWASAEPRMTAENRSPSTSRDPVGISGRPAPGETQSGAPAYRGPASFATERGQTFGVASPSLGCRRGRRLPCRRALRHESRSQRRTGAWRNRAEPRQASRRGRSSGRSRHRRPAAC